MEDYTPQIQKISDNSLEKNKNRYRPQKIWTNLDEIKLMAFITQNLHIFNGKSKRRTFKIFKQLSQFLADKTPAQCRSHFQYLLNQFGTVSKVKKHFRAEFGKIYFDLQLSHFTQILRRQDQSQEASTKEIGVQCTAEELKKTNIDMMKQQEYGQAFENVQNMLPFNVFGNMYEQQPLYFYWQPKVPYQNELAVKIEKNNTSS